MCRFIEKFAKKLARERPLKLIETDNSEWHELFKGDETVPWRGEIARNGHRANPSFGIGAMKLKTMFVKKA